MNDPGLAPRGAMRLREDLGAIASRATLPAERDSAIRAAIRSAFPAAASTSSPAVTLQAAGRARAVAGPRTLRSAAPGWARALQAAAVIVVALIALRFAGGSAVPDRRLVEIASLVEHAPSGGRALGDPRLQALLAAIVSMPPPSREPLPAVGEFVVIDLLLDEGSAMPLAWKIELTTDGQLVGIEGGDRPFARPAAYDPAALLGGRVLLANAADEPTATDGSRRLASVTVRTSGRTNVAPGTDTTTDTGVLRVVEAALVGTGGETLALPVRCVRRATAGALP